MKGFPPICDRRTEVMVFGSFPSPKSLDRHMYYGHPQNHFWKIMENIIGEPLYDVEYGKRKKMLLQNKIGVWDVYQGCEREGSSDSRITCQEVNHFRLLKKKAPRLKKCVFNGKEAGKFAPVLEELGYATAVLPSTSPRNTLRMREKLRRWKRAFDNL